MSGLASLSVGSPLSYLIAFALPFLDAVLPLLPSETVIIAFGVATAGSRDPRIALVVLCAAAGAFAGDNLCYLIGWRFGPWATRRFFSGEKGSARRDWAERSLNRYGIGLIIVCRFIPAGRTAVTLACGLVRYPWRRFAPAVALAAVVWASYAFFAGRIGGQAFEHQPVVGFVVAFGGALLLSGLFEAARRIIDWRTKRRARTAAAGGNGAAGGNESAGGSGPGDGNSRGDRGGSGRPDGSGERGSARGR